MRVKATYGIHVYRPSKPPIASRQARYYDATRTVVLVNSYVRVRVRVLLRSVRNGEGREVKGAGNSTGTQVCGHFLEGGKDRWVGIERWTLCDIPFYASFSSGNAGLLQENEPVRGCPSFPGGRSRLLNEYSAIAAQNPHPTCINW
eukprot:scaffold172725_cov33-Prasinocladus_malaysianus.AAC.1